MVEDPNSSIHTLKRRGNDDVFSMQSYISSRCLDPGSWNKEGVLSRQLCWTFYRGATDDKAADLTAKSTPESCAVWTSWFVTWLVTWKDVDDPIPLKDVLWKNLTFFVTVYTIEIGTRHISDHIKLVGQYPCFHDVKQTMLSSCSPVNGTQGYLEE